MSKFRHVQVEEIINKIKGFVPEKKSVPNVSSIDFRFFDPLSDKNRKNILKDF